MRWGLSFFTLKLIAGLTPRHTVDALVQKGRKKLGLMKGLTVSADPLRPSTDTPPHKIWHTYQVQCAIKKIMAWVTGHHKKITAKIYRVSIRPRAGLQPPTWAACCASTDWTKHVNWIGTIHVSLYTLLFLLVMPCSCTAWHKKWTQYSGFHTAGQGDS